ncbi:MAG TPA: glycosyltransferase family 2 protein [Syntrophales bacterium]|nr:glycosyltransferase family 2 protein [Syntrophales bacterium]HQN78063.1 glycosyltransferase family 2 protein [Syntrophales bacterium]
MHNLRLPKISIIIPVYNGEKYIRNTLDSIKKQIFQDYEVLCINDSSIDKSIEILKEYNLQDTRFRYYNTEYNLGIVPKVINYALPLAKGEYYVYSSQDDLFSEDWLNCMYKRAIETNADAVIPDVVLYHQYSPQKNKILSGINGDKSIVLSNRDAFIYSLDWTIPGNALWRLNLIKKIGYYDFSMNADEYSARVFFLNCNKVVFSCGTFFYRQDNPSAITKKFSIKMFDIPFTDFKLWELAKKHEFNMYVQLNLISKSIRELLKYNSYTLFGKHKTAKEKIYKCYQAYQDNKISTYLWNQNTNSVYLESIITYKYTLFYAFTVLFWFKRILLYLLRTFHHILHFHRN